MMSLRIRKCPGSAAVVEWSDLRYLLALARAGSLGVAARSLGVATTTVSRRIDALEAALGLRLVERSADGARLTPEGARLVELAAGMEESAAAVQRAASDLRGTGVVRVSATETVIADLLAPALGALYAERPALRLELRSNASLVSLSRADADLAVRMARPDDSALLVRRLAPITLGLFASRAYLRGRAPEGLTLGEERVLAYDDGYGPIPEVRWVREAGLGPAQGLRTTSTRALLEAARAGVGIALLSRALASRAGLIEIPAPSPIPPRVPHLLMHRDLRRVPDVRAVADWIRDTLDAALRETPRRTSRR